MLKGTNVILQGFFTNKYLQIWGHMKALHPSFIGGMVARSALGIDCVTAQNVD